MTALRIYAGPLARRHIEQQGLQASDVGVVPGAAGGPKGLILGPLDRHIFGHWLPAAQRARPVHLVGASIGAWRMASACLDEPLAALAQFEQAYIEQDFALAPGQRRPSAQAVSAQFAANLQAFYGPRAAQVLGQQRYHLHIVTSRGRHLLAREGRWRTPLGYAGAFVSNAVHRRALGAWLERVVFSSRLAPLPFASGDLPTQQVCLDASNFHPALQASCSIPFVLQAVQGIAHAPAGAYWDGGITDYHLHLAYRPEAGLVLYPHFQRAVVPGWLDKSLRWRHRSSAALARTLVLAPDPDWVRRLPNAKLPDRHDFVHYAGDLAGRVRAWRSAVAASAQLADEWQAWLDNPDPSRLEPL